MPDLILFIRSCFVLNLAFGPNNLLAISHGAHCGVRFAFAASTARLTVFVPMIAVSALGLGVLLSASFSTVFGTVKLVGAACLLWLGLGLLRTSAAPHQVHAAKVAPRPFWMSSETRGWSR